MGVGGKSLMNTEIWVIKGDSICAEVGLVGRVNRVDEVERPGRGAWLGEVGEELGEIGIVVVSSEPISGNREGASGKTLDGRGKSIRTGGKVTIGEEL